MNILSLTSSGFNSKRLVQHVHLHITSLVCYSVSHTSGKTDDKRKTKKETVTGME